MDELLYIVTINMINQRRNKIMTKKLEMRESRVIGELTKLYDLLNLSDTRLTNLNKITDDKQGFINKLDTFIKDYVAYTPNEKSILKAYKYKREELTAIQNEVDPDYNLATKDISLIEWISAYGNLSVSQWNEHKTNITNYDEIQGLE